MWDPPKQIQAHMSTPFFQQVVGVVGNCKIICPVAGLSCSLSLDRLTAGLRCNLTKNLTHVLSVMMINK